MKPKVSPRTLMKVPVTFRDQVREHAAAKGQNMMQYLVAIATAQMNKETV